MDIESHESAMLLKESSPRRRQGLALKLAVLLCGLGLLVNLNGPVDTNIGVTFSSNKEQKKVTATAEVSPAAPKSSVMRMDWRAAAVAAPAWSVEDDTTRTPFGYCARGGGFRMMSRGFFVPGAQIFNESYPGREDEWPVYATSPMVPARLDFETLVAEDYSDVDSVYWHGVMGSVENEWYGTTAGSELDVLIVQSNYPEGKEGVPVIVPARGAKWAFSEIYGRLAALQAAGAAPIIEAWLAGELPLTSFP